MLLVCSNVEGDQHDSGHGHPERPARTRAALDGLVAAGLSDAIVHVEPRPATPTELVRVHPARYLDRIAAFCANGGGHLDEDTAVSPGSWGTALLAAGAGLEVVRGLDDGLATHGLVLARPPGHHAGSETAMGFCLINNVAVTAAALTSRGERVAILDWDVHHGNGTQDIFWDDPDVLYISLHQRGLYPGTGAVTEVGGAQASGGNLNVPLPPGTSGEALRQAMDDLILPAMTQFAPTWLLISAGFDGHRDDPLAQWLLTSPDYADFTTQVSAVVSPGHLIAFLEGGYDLSALTNSVGAVGAALLGESYRPESSSTGSIGRDDVSAITTWRSRQSWFVA